MIKVSIVTICYNEASNIVATLESVVGQTYKNVEYVVKDGGSTDGTVDLLRNFADKIGLDKWCSADGNGFVWETSRDGGLYKGMNAGLAKCTGDYVLFCNAGDRLASDDVIVKMVAKAEAEGLPDLVYGDCASESNGELMIRSAHGPGFMRIGMPASHEAMMYKRELIQKLALQYDTTYRIAADYKFTYQFVNAAKSFAYVPIPVVVFAEGGVSTANKWKGLMEASRVRKEVSGLPMISRLGIIGMQCVALFLSTYAAPLYRAIRLRKAG